MTVIYIFLLATLFALTSAGSFGFCPKYKIILVRDTANKAGGLQHAVNKYRRLLGDPDNLNERGPLFKGRREINWDADAVPFKMPGNFFDATVTRGAVFSALGGQFRVSNPVDPPNGDVRFSTLLPNSVTDQFQTFSPKRLFTPFLSNVMAMTFRIPAKGIVARTSGFGAVFTDVDLFSGTTLTYFDSKGCIIARIAVPPRNRGLSFAGIVVVNHSGRRISVIKKVVMKFGNVAVAKAGKSKGDVVVADDFLYGEPRV